MRTLAVGLVGVFIGLSVPAIAHSPAPCAEEDMLKKLVVWSNGHKHYKCVNTDDFIARFVTTEVNYQVDGAIQGDICNNRRYWKREYGIAPIVSEACDGH